MSTDPNTRQVPITSRKTGDVRLSKPTPVHNPNSPAADSVMPQGVPNSTPPPSQRSPLESDGEARAPTISPAQSLSSTEPPGKPSETENGVDEVQRETKASKTAKSKPDIETLEQFIEYAYGRRGQRVSLPLKVQQVISQQPHLDEAAVGRLLVAVNADSLLAVPRQILLASREVEGLPALRGALTNFVSMVMLRTPVFALDGVQAAVFNRPEALSVSDALKAVAAYAPVPVEGAESLKPADLKELRRNAAHLLATWIAVHRGLSVEEVSNLLFHVLWEPAANVLADDNAKLRALTEVEDFAGVGVAVKRYRQNAADARNAQEQALRDASGVRSRAAELAEQRDRLQEELNVRTEELQSLRASSAEELAALRQAHSAGTMHQSHELESLRGRLVRRLEDSIEMLDVGLSALRNRTPRVEVMIERAEHVIDDLRSELNSLKDGE